MCNGTSSLVRLHDTFDSKEQIKIVLGRKDLEEGFQIRYPRLDPHRKLSKCRAAVCRNLANVGQQMANLKASQKSGKVPGGHTFHG
ncbi:hypothetical protein Tco_1170880, partial [Tanacetum coccineum]